MVEGAKASKSTLAEIRDQLAHASAGMVIMYLIVLFPVLGIAVVVMLIALVRELNQHGWQGYGALDLIFWGVGCAVFTLLYYAVGVPDLESIRATLLAAWQA